LVEREVFSHRVSLRMELAPALPVVLADRIQLRQVLINLVINGIEAMQMVTDRPRELKIRSRQEASDRWNSVLPTIRSSCVTRLVMTEGTRSSFCAAALKLPVFATATKARIEAIVSILHDSRKLNR
jgi:signal transduction histidine kinase